MLPHTNTFEGTSESDLVTELKRSVSDYQSLVNSVDGIVWQADPKTFRFSFVSRSALKLGYPLQQWLDDPAFWKDHIHPDDRERAASYCTACILQKISHQLEYRMIAADGRIVYIHDNVSVMVENNEAVLLRGIMTDITERKRANKESQMAERRLLFHLENSPLAFIEWDSLVRPKSWSKRAEEIFGWTEKDVRSEQFNWYSNVYEEDLPLVNRIAEQLATGEVEKAYLEYRNYTKDGRMIWCAWFNSVLKDKEGKVIALLSLVLDITERKLAELKLKRNEAVITGLNMNLEKRAEELSYQNEEKEKRAAELIIANKELVFQNEEKEKRAAELIIANKELVFQNEEKEKRAAELIIANKELVFQNEEKEKRAAELIIANKELVFQNEEKEKRATELILANVELKKTEDELKKLSMVAKETINGVVIRDEHQNIVWVNAAFTKMYGYELYEVIGKNPKKFLPGSQSDGKTIHDAKDRFMKKEPFVFEVLNYTKTGTKIYVRIQVQPMFDENGDTKQSFALHTDITEKKLAEAELKKLSRVVKETINGVVISDRNENIVWVNNAFTKMYGYEPDEAIGKNVGQLLRGADTDMEVVKSIKEKVLKKDPFSFEILNYTKSGEKIYIKVQVQLVLDDKGDIEQFFSIETDITLQKQLEEKVELEKIIKQKQITNAVFAAQENERSEIGRELHDNVNQLLSATRLYIDMARRDEPDRDSLLSDASSFALNAIEEIRKLSKTLITPLIKEIGLADSVKDLAEEVMLVHPIRILFTATNFTEDGLSDKFKLNIFRIVQEQINNTLKHAHAKKINIHFEERDGKLIISITDNGIGFDITKRKPGVGLINIKSRSELYNGVVHLNSGKEKGTALSLTFNKESLLLKDLDQAN